MNMTAVHESEDRKRTEGARVRNGIQNASYTPLHTQQTEAVITNLRIAVIFLRSLVGIRGSSTTG